MKITKYYHKNSDVVAFKRIVDENGHWEEFNYNDRRLVLSYENSDGFSYKFTYDEQGNELTYEETHNYFEIKGKEVTEEEFNNFLKSKQ